MFCPAALTAEESSPSSAPLSSQESFEAQLRAPLYCTVHVVHEPSRDDAMQWTQPRPPARQRVMCGGIIDVG
jgi:hypothetical protein